jgi:hypothetical protein
MSVHHVSQGAQVFRTGRGAVKEQEDASTLLLGRDFVPSSGAAPLLLSEVSFIIESTQMRRENLNPVLGGEKLHPCVSALERVGFIPFDVL